MSLEYCCACHSKNHCHCAILCLMFNFPSLISSIFFFSYYFAHLFPLMNVTYKSGQAQQSEETEDLGEAYDAQSPSGAVDLCRLKSCLYIHHQEDVVHRNGGDEVHHKPASQVTPTDHLRVQDDLGVVAFHNAGTEVEDEVSQEEGIGSHVEGDPWQRVLILKEGDAPWQNDEVAHHQAQHHQVPIEPVCEDA